MPSSRASRSRRAASTSSSGSHEFSDLPIPGVQWGIRDRVVKNKPSLDPFPVIVVPLPRRPLFPGYMTATYLKNQPTLTRCVCGGGGDTSEEKKTTVAAFMLKDTADYHGCILRPGLQGKELLERLHSVGTLAETRGPIRWTHNGQMYLYGLRRVRMTGHVITEDPLTVMVEPMKEVLEEDKKLNRLLHNGRTPRAHIDREVLSMYRPFKQVFKLLESLVNHHHIDPQGQVGFYMGMWESEVSYLPDFGPAVLPVLNRSLHQRALEEPDRSKRMQLTITMLKQELLLDNNFARELDLNEDVMSEEEKELVAQLRRVEENPMWEQGSLASKGETVMAPSVQIRVRMNAFHDMMSPDVMHRNKRMLKDMRISEHMTGY